MFDFVRKRDIWDACDQGYLDELKHKNISYQLKTAQDLAIYRHVRDLHGLDIGEIGGGNSRILERLALRNRCVNIEKFEGRDLGPTAPIALNNVRNVNAYVGEFDSALPSDAFDLVFSISVVEHVETPKLDAFFRDLLRILRPGGLFLHAIDVYLQEDATPYVLDRLSRYRNWVAGQDGVAPFGAIYSGPLRFATDMISNPDNILHGWNKAVPSLSGVRAASQSVSVIVGGSKFAGATKREGNAYELPGQHP
jgi:SAM-dependent methyltransferase